MIKKQFDMSKFSLHLQRSLEVILASLLGNECLVRVTDSSITDTGDWHFNLKVSFEVQNKPPQPVPAVSDSSSPSM